MGNKNMKEAQPTRMMGMKEFQEVMGCSKSMAYDIASQGDFPKIVINSRIFIPVEKFNKWVENYTGKHYFLLK